VPRRIKFLIAGVALALAAVPATFIVTLLLYPFWSWVEATYRIESVGHSGPADWCFIVVYGVFLVLLLLLLWCGWRHRVIRSKLPRRAAKGMPAVPRRTIAMKRTSMEQRMEWEQRLADLWASIDQLSEQAYLSKMEFLVAELPLTVRWRHSSGRARSSRPVTPTLQCRCIGRHLSSAWRASAAAGL